MLTLAPYGPIPIVTAIPSFTTAGLDLLGLDMEGSLACQLSVTAADGDVVDIYASNAPAITTLAQAEKIGSIGEFVAATPLPGQNPIPGMQPVGTGGQAPTLFAPPRMRFLYVNRTAGTTAGLNLFVTGQETPGTAVPSGKVAILQNGNALGVPIHIGSTDNQLVIVSSGFAGGVPELLLNEGTGVAELFAANAVALATNANGALQFATATPSFIDMGVGAKGDTAVRAGQQTFASGSFGVAGGDAQAWQLVLRGVTPGLAPGETIELLYGPNGDQFVTLENGKSYAIDAIFVAESAGGVDFWSYHPTFQFKTTVQQEAGVITTGNPFGPGAALHAVGSAGAASWTAAIAAAVGPTRVEFTFTDTGSTAVIRCVAYVRVVELAHS